MDIKKAVQETVSEIYRDQGQVTPSSLVETAKSKTSPIHNAFEWDNKKAGHEFRLMQARTWIRKVTITINNSEERFIHIPRIGPDETTKEGYYKPMSVVVNLPDEYQRAKMAMVSKLNAAQFAIDELETAAANRVDIPKTDFKRAKRAFREVREALSA